MSVRTKDGKVILLNGAVSCECCNSVIYAWYDASDPSSIQLDEHKNVISWNDKSGYDNHLINSLYRPTYDRNYDGLNVVNFQNDGQYLTCANMSVPQTDLTYFMVCQVDSVNSFSDAIMSVRDLAVDNTWQLTSYDTNRFNGALARGNIARHLIPFGNTDLSGEYHIFEVAFDNVKREDRIYLNGMLKGAVGDMPISIQNGGQFALFRNRARNNFAQGAAAEVICAGSVEQMFRQKIEGYLAWKWGLVSKLPADHPYKTKRSPYFPN